MARSRKSPTPLDAAALERLALRYVERFATSRGRLAAYLDRKIFEYGAAGDLDSAAVAERMAARGYVDDIAYAEARAASLTRRGYGARRVTDALRHAAIDADRIAPIVDGLPQVQAALAFARRRRIGPFANGPVERPERERQIAALVRAGHGYALSRRIAEASDESEIAADDVD